MADGDGLLQRSSLSRHQQPGKKAASLSIPEAIIMTTVTGKTTNGFTYEGDYQHASSDRVTWTAIFRRSGVFFGMRHGRISELTGVPAGEISEAVQDDIEFVWVQAR
jgi:hypothetical protein